ncbi:MAG: hypothetical protein BWY31_02894 [Lentisphaerae bacterium ADurb.Bin242]|nr:MAG: hypothetical protein BWY31_02894 [Lentisphaerae bacterium ADurb.Bin242]
MKLEDLPVGNAPKPVPYPHFPARWQVFVWRNWEMVPPRKIAEILHCSEAEILNAAVEMGLSGTPVVPSKWVSHGYLTLIRNNWQLLNYGQLLALLDWTPEKMAYTLKEEDFFWSKVGKLKPLCENLRYASLTSAEHDATALLKKNLRKHFPEKSMPYQEPPFAFAEKYAARPSSGGKDKFEFNFIHSYAASCGDVLANADLLDPVPENLLEQYASMGIKGVWMHALMYLLCPIPGAEEYSEGHEKRLENLKKIVTRCVRHGIKVYLYLNEPRCMPLPFYDKKPHWGGVDVPANHTKTICVTRTNEPLEWLENAVKSLFHDVPELGGLLTITMSENPTNCNYSLNKNECPSCRNVPGEDIIAKVITAMERGMHASAPDAKLLAYDWAWRRHRNDTDNIEFKKGVLDRLPRNVYVTTVSEWGKETNAGGVQGSVVDYSISQVGPSREAVEVWKHAQKLGIGVVAKVQINNSWELSGVPYIPVPYLIQEHLDNLAKAGVNGLMLSWTLGGFPGGNLELLTASPEEVASRKFHKEAARKICEAWKKFSEAFREFPFHVGTLYVGPMNYGPMNLLHLEKTGYAATMIGFPYDDIGGWRSIYPEDVLEDQFRKLTEGWKKGLDTLAELEPLIREGERAEYEEIRTISRAAYCHLRSTYLQVRFTRARNNGFDRAVMKECAREELELAVELHKIARADSRIGFEASNHYYYSLNDLREKVICCENILAELNQ